MEGVAFHLSKSHPLRFRALPRLPRCVLFTGASKQQLAPSVQRITRKARKALLPRFRRNFRESKVRLACNCRAHDTTLSIRMAGRRSELRRVGRKSSAEAACTVTQTGLGHRRKAPTPKSFPRALEQVTAATSATPRRRVIKPSCQRGGFASSTLAARPSGGGWIAIYTAGHPSRRCQATVPLSVSFNPFYAREFFHPA